MRIKPNDIIIIRYIIIVVYFSCIVWGNLLPQIDLNQNVEIKILKDKVDDLERKVIELEEKINQLEQNKPVKTKDYGNIQFSGDWKILDNWRKLVIGMTFEEVKKILGEPIRVSAHSYGHEIYYTTKLSRAKVRFSAGRVDGWEEP